MTVDCSNTLGASCVSSPVLMSPNSVTDRFKGVLVVLVLVVMEDDEAACASLSLFAVSA